MKFAIIVGSQRKVSQSAKVGAFLARQLTEKFNVESFIIDLGKNPLPLWAEGKQDGAGIWAEHWAPVAKELTTADAMVVISPEYNGMVPPALKNFFLLCDNGELFHKPGLIVSVSAAANGAYPVAELRSMSYKNTRLLWIPEQIIVRYAEKNFNDDATELTKEDTYLRTRADYALAVLTEYAKAMGPVRTFAEKGRKVYPNGM